MDYNKPLYCNVHVALAFNTDAGIVYERLKWLIQHSAKEKQIGTEFEGRWWVIFDYESLRVNYLPILKSAKALRDIIAKLEKHGLILSRQSRTGKWYAVGDVDPASLTSDVNLESPETAVQCHPACRPASPCLPPEVTQTDVLSQPLIYKDLESTLETTAEATEETTFSSSSTSPVPDTPAVEEKETSASVPVMDLDQRLLEAFAKLVGVYGGSSVQMKAALAGGLCTILKAYPDAQPSHFRHFNEYHQEQNQNRKTGPRYALPKIKYVVDGWGQFVQWWESHCNASQWGFIPGTDNYLGMERWEWDELSDMESGAMIQIRGQWVYRKQANGTFTEVPCEQWPDEWKRESA